MITDEVVEKACTIYFGSQNWPHDVEEVELVRISMRDALEAVAPMLVPDGWQPIETAPKDGERILLCDADNATLGWWQKSEDDGVDYMGADAGFVDHAFNDFNPGRSFGNESYQYKGNQPTHWMPLPKPRQ